MINTKSMIFSVLGCAGVVGTALAAIYETKKAVTYVDSKLGMAKYMEEDPPLIKKIGKTIWNYKFTILAGAGTITSIALAQRESIKFAMGISATAAGIVTNREAIMDAVRQRTMENPDIADEVELEAAGRSWKPEVSIEDTGFGKQLCVFAWTNRWFYSDERAIAEQLHQFNEELLHDLHGTTYGGYAALNDIYISLGMEPDQFGEINGFAPDYYDDEEGVIFKIDRVHQWHDYFGNVHDVDIVVIRFDDGNYPFECYLDC